MLGNALDVFQVVQKDLLVFLISSRLLVGLINLKQVILLLVNQRFGVLHGIKQVEVLPVLIGLGVHGVKQLHQALVKLGQLNIGRTRFDLPLQNSNLPILVS